MSKFFKKIINLLPIATLVLGMNYYEDPSQLFREQYERGLAKLLLSGKNAAGVADYDERKLQKYLIEGQTAPADIVVLGSSRSMQISSEWFPGFTFFNNSVSGGTIQDYVAIFELYAERGQLPKIIVICMDPWILNGNNHQNRWQSLRTEYLAGLNRIGMPRQDKGSSDLSVEKYLELLSPGYFQAAIKKYVDSIGNPNPLGYYATADSIGEQAIRRSDGSLAYPREVRDATPSAVLEGAREFVASQHIYSLEDFSLLDRDAEKISRLLIRYMVLHGVRVIVLLTPYHPYVYNQLISSTDYQRIQNAETYFVGVTIRNGAQAVGSYDPAAIPCSADEFYDGMHARETCLKRIISTSGLTTGN